MARYWFRPKRYGFGATPVTWEGWLLTLGYAALAIGVAIGIARLVPVDRAGAGMLLGGLGIAGGLFWGLARVKTNGDWRWRWGGDD
jgi:hypothetical protein